MAKIWLWQQKYLPYHQALCKHRHYSSSVNIPKSLQSAGKGRVALFVHEDFDYSELSTTKYDIECVVAYTKSSEMYIDNVNRPPNLPIGHFCD